MTTMCRCFLSGVLAVIASSSYGDGEKNKSADAPLFTEMVFIPAGEFTMGTSAEEAQQLAKEYKVHPDLILLESPQRKVNLKAFWIDRFPVSNRQFLEFAQATKTPTGWPDDKLPEGQADHPKVGISWPAAEAYAKWAGKRLPTAEEWEKAARGTDGRLYPWGNEWKETATMRRPPDAFMPPTMISYTLPVGCFPEGASPYGVMDMCGNVPEWTATPSLKNATTSYVVKGAGATCNLKCYFRCASVAFSSWSSYGGKGFRCVKDATGSPPESYKLAPLVKRDAPPFPQPQAPREDLYLKQPINLRDGISFPYLPEGHISLMAPEGAQMKIGESDKWLGLSACPNSTTYNISTDGTRSEHEWLFAEQLIMIRTVLEAYLDYVDLKLTVKNFSSDATRVVRVNVCHGCGLMPYFYDQEDARTYIITDAGPTRLIECPPFGGQAQPLYRFWAILPPGQAGRSGTVPAREPFVCTVSPDGKWVMAVTGPGGQGFARNANYSCLHLGQDAPEIKPGMEHTTLWRYYYMRGGVQDALARWRKDLASGALDTTAKAVPR